MKHSVKIEIGEYLDDDLPTPVTTFIDELQDLMDEAPYPYRRDVLISRSFDYNNGNGRYILYYYRPETPEEEQKRALRQAEYELRTKELERDQYEHLKAKVERGEI